MAKGKKPKAIIAVHLYGVPYQIEAVRIIADKYKIPILEDSAEALGSSYKGQKCGTFGDIGVLSFNGNKIITTSGGGAIVTKTAEQKEKARKMGLQTTFHAPHGGADFLGWRKARNGATEIVYDDGVTRRMVWRVANPANEARIVEALRVSVASLRIVPTLYDELKKRAIAIERV